ncbi:hypothetical protein VCHA57P526_20039 [Vibrio chagasii]|nr:hypothetical protein VCHA30O60_10045 [Vibrio chagasii]CAH7071420.1 hypothetical protein VCHA34P120_70205 [Vibrio chagasii]CAH7094577.1 hypothetical protein VCHA38P217_100041 [Vibrio chagasii]CAH7095950.1 hypothetical protein VCHA32O87_90039 [Vibrio chagasii]CAH7108580.1 hypothetical protein VCHA55P509_220044 [Vibrio chagasii]
MAQFHRMSRFTNLRLNISDDKLISVLIQFYDTYLIDRITSSLVPKICWQLTISYTVT